MSANLRNLVLVKNGRDDEATKIIADVLNTLHFANRSEIPDRLTPLSQRFQSLFDKANQDREQDSVYRRGAAVARDLLCEQGPAHVLHGDIHHENIRQHRERGWLAIDPKGLIGERAYDAANALCNPHSLPKIVQNPERLIRQADIIATALDLDRKRLLSYTFAHACLSACWSLEDGDDPSHALAMAEITESCINQYADPVTVYLTRPAH
jgi:streptomycin 6-kinase